jgi:hypothetical protein
VGCGLTLLGAILGLVLGPIVGSLVSEILSGQPLGTTGAAEAGLGGFVYGVFLGPFVGMVALPLLVSLGQNLRRRR